MLTKLFISSPVHTIPQMIQAAKSSLDSVQNSSLNLYKLFPLLFMVPIKTTCGQCINFGKKLSNFNDTREFQDDPWSKLSCKNEVKYIKPYFKKDAWKQKCIANHSMSNPAKLNWHLFKSSRINMKLETDKALKSYPNKETYFALSHSYCNNCRSW